MAGPAEGEGGYRQEEGEGPGQDAGPTHSQWHSPGQHTQLRAPGASQDRLSPYCNQQENDDFSLL